MIKNLSYYNLLRFKENNRYTQNLHGVTIFPYTNLHENATFTKIIINFSLKGVEFNKKKALPFFLAVELLTNQKCVATLSSKNILAWKLRKGALVGCKVSLRKDNLYEFLDNLYLALPRMEKFKGVSIESLTQKNNNSLSLLLAELILFYPIELGLGINTDVKRVELNFLFKNFSLEEKIFLLTSNKIPLKS